AASARRPPAASVRCFCSVFLSTKHAKPACDHPADDKTKGASTAPPCEGGWVAFNFGQRSRRRRSDHEGAVHAAGRSLRTLHATGSGVLGAAVLVLAQPREPTSAMPRRDTRPPSVAPPTQRPRNDAGAGPSASGLAQLAPGQIPLLEPPTPGLKCAEWNPSWFMDDFALAQSNAWSAVWPEVNDADVSLA
ncbi:hypothetical protein T492DRAFT_871440, partial [Pavlovales sp. CCMP2436]